MVMDRMLLKNRSLTSNLPHLGTKKSSRGSHCILMFSMRYMKLFSNDKRVSPPQAMFDLRNGVYA